MTTSPQNRLFLLDGMALAYRAHFAFFANPIRNSQGMNTSAVYGFANTLQGLLEQEQPTHIAACFDTSEPTARHKLFSEYKATRESMPEELKEQIPWIFKLLEAMNIPILRYPGFEADDTIGTLSSMADKSGDFLTYMVSQDKDLAQLISETCFLWKPGKKGSDHEVIGLNELQEQWGVNKPEQIVDLLALMGDTADNIPGIPGIGKKTAAMLINDFGCVENLLNHIDQLKGKRKETIESHAEEAILSKKLVLIDRQVPLRHELHDLIRKDANYQELIDLYTTLEFRMLLKKLTGDQVTVSSFPQDDLFAPKNASSHSVSPVIPCAENTEGSPQLELFETIPVHNIEDIPHDYRIISSHEERQAMVEELKKYDSWCFDTETTGLDPLNDTLLGIAFSACPSQAWYLPINSQEDIEAVRELLEGSSEKIGHNLKFDIQVLRAAGVHVTGPFFDSMLAHAIVAPGLKHGMDALAESLLHYKTIKLSDIAPNSDKKKKLNVKDIPTDVLGQYSAEDADITLQLSQLLKKQVEESGMADLFRNVEIPLMPVLADMEYEGIRVEPAKLREASIQTGVIIDTLRNKIEQEAGHPLNLNSPKQLGTFLFEKLCLVKKPKKTKTGQYVTDEATLTTLSHIHPVVEDILSYRENMKLKSTYLDALPQYINPKDGRVHSQFHQLLTTTGRLTSIDPNLQNIPVRTEQGRLIRTAFVPTSGEFSILSADYSQIELRIMAALSGDESMCQAFREGRDIHTETAARLYGISRDDVTPDMRRAAKTVNFGIIYGISAFGLSQRIGCTRGEAGTLIDNYFLQFPGISAFMNKLVHQAEQKGYSETLLGRRRPLPDILSANKTIKAAAERTAINSPIQGTAADMIKIAMINVHHLLQGKRSKLILQIHDELLVDLHRDEQDLIPQIKQAMISALPLPNEVPILVEAQTGDNWLEAH